VIPVEEDLAGHLVVGHLHVLESPTEGGGEIEGESRLHVAPSQLQVDDWYGGADVEFGSEPAVGDQRISV